MEAVSDRAKILSEGDLPANLSSGDVKNILVTLAREAMRHFKDGKKTSYDHYGKPTTHHASKPVVAQTPTQANHSVPTGSSNHAFMKRVENVLKNTGMSQKEFDHFWKENSGKMPADIDLHDVDSDTLKRIISAFTQLMK